MENLPVHYRYTDSVDAEGLILVEHKFYPIRETECFYFILPKWEHNLYINGQISRADRAKRVSKSGRVRKCYPTKEEAFESYKIRKNKQLWHAQNALNIATLASLMLEDVTDPESLKKSQYDNCRVIGHAPFIDEYTFD